ncbi:MAG: RNA polymerase sigma factor [Coriobacteriales bacterium]|nr:RNA polymerase sigma factor [Coriobacteriales bacterium]
MALRLVKGRLTRRELDAFFNEYYPRIYNYLYYRLLNSAVADDLTSEVMVRVVRNYDQFDASKGPLDAWVFRIARNVLFSYFRSNKETSDIENVPQNLVAYTDDDPLLEDDGVLVRKALESLTDEERELVYLKYWEELSNNEIGERLGLNPSTISTKIWRANNKMREALAKERE